MHELTAGFEFNLAENHIQIKNLELVKQLKGNYKQVKFFNFSASPRGKFGKSLSSDFIDMLKNFDKDTELFYN